MKKIINKILNIPTPYFAIIAISSAIIVTLFIQEAVTIPMLIGIIVLALLIGLQIHLGSIVIKSLIASFVVLYSTSLYTSLAINIEGYVTQPFLLTISAVTLFLGQTYRKSHVYSLRSRALWSSVLAVILVIVKSASLLNGNSFWITEVIGLNLFIIYTFSWNLWIRNSRKTRVVKPMIVKEEIKDGYKFIEINNELDVLNNKWKGNMFNKKNSNSYPYIYNEVMSANENKLKVVFLSNIKTSEFYDIGEIYVNRSLSIPYLYIEAKEKHYVNTILNRFVEEAAERSK